MLTNNKQGVQGLQAFAFSVVIVNDEHREPRFKESVGVKFKEGICAEWCLKFRFESDWCFCKITESGWFWKRLSRKSLQKQPCADALQIGALRNFAIFTGKHLCWILVLTKLQGLRPATLFKRDFNADVFLWILRNLYK